MKKRKPSLIPTAIAAVSKKFRFSKSISIQSVTLDNITKEIVTMNNENSLEEETFLPCC